MSRAIGLLFFVLGCALIAVAVVWFLFAQKGVLIAPTTCTENVIAFVLYGILMLATLDRVSVHRWRPVMRITPLRIVIARVSSAAAGANCLISMVSVCAGRRFDSAAVVSFGFSWLISSLLLLNGVYVALHWAFRPQNLFGPNVPGWLLNPLGIVVVPILKIVGVARFSPRNEPGEEQ